MQKLIFDNSTYEEDKPVIHKLNQTIIIFFIHLEETRYGLQWLKLYHLHMIKIAKVVVNQIQIDIHNMKQNIDIMRS